jgi:signal transduction histidine kinase
VIGVRDYGPGVPKDQMRKIFRLFYRVDSGLSRETLGTGIGLALVRQLAEAMGGTVDVTNRDPGAEFSVAIPRARPSSG